jgi:hypothetical protein
VIGQVDVSARRRHAPLPSYTHLTRLSDDTGLFEHARHAVVRREHGYCTDDVARGLVVVSRDPDRSPTMIRLAEIYLTFLTHAQDGQGAFHNRLSYGREWTDRPGLGDWWGRALWGLGTAAARSPVSWIRAEAMVAFTVGATRRSPAPHAMAFAGLGAAEVLRADPENAQAAALLSDAAAAVGRPGSDPLWPWPQPALSYASGALAEVVIAAGHLLGDGAGQAAGVRMLSWLRDIQSADGHLSALPAHGWRRGTDRQRYDQQPIEVAAFADACATAAAATGDAGWYDGVRQSVDWFLGANDGGAEMWDRDTGGGYDGLTPDGANLNQGAESTLALIATLQHARNGSHVRSSVRP